MMITMADTRVSPAAARKPTGVTKGQPEQKVRKRGYKRITVACTYCRHRKVRCEFTNEEDPYRRCDNCIKLDRCECRLRPVNDNEELQDAEMDLFESASPSPSLEGGKFVKMEEQKSPTQAPVTTPNAPPFGLLNTNFTLSSPQTNQGLTRSNSAASTFSRRDTIDSTSTPASLTGRTAPLPVVPSQKLTPSATWPLTEMNEEFPPFDPSAHTYLNGGFWNEPFAPTVPNDISYMPMSVPETMFFDPQMATASPTNYMWNPQNSPALGFEQSQQTVTRASSPVQPSATMSPNDLHSHTAAQLPARANSTGGKIRRSSTMPLVPPQWQQQGPATVQPLQSNFNPFDWSWDSATYQKA